MKRVSGFVEDWNEANNRAEHNPRGPFETGTNTNSRVEKLQDVSRHIVR